MSEVATFRVVQLGMAGRGAPLATGAGTELAPGVRLILADADGNAMVERQGDVTVMIDGQPVYEVAHCRPQQRLTVGVAEFTLLPPYGMIVHPNGGVAALASDPPRARSTGGVTKRVRVLGGAALVALISVGGTVSWMSSSAAPAPVRQPVATRVIPAPVVSAPVPVLAPLPRPAPTPQVVASRSKEESPAPPPPKKKATKAADIAASTSAVALPAAKEHGIRTQIESYQLEAGFDPEGAARKLRQLKGTLPANARVQKDIDRALRSIGI